MVSRTLFSSNKMDWETPQWLFDMLHGEFDFTIDLAANAHNAKCFTYLGLDHPDKGRRNALAVPWEGRGWLNPPYGRGVGKWIEKAYLETRQPWCEMVAMLIPSRTDTRYWHDYVMRASEIRFIKGRLTFVGATRPCPFPSSIIVFKGGDISSPKISTLLRRE